MLNLKLRSIYVTIVSFLFIQAVQADEKNFTVSFSTKELSSYEKDFKPAFLVLKRNSSEGSLTVDFKLKTDAKLGKDYLLSSDKFVFNEGELVSTIKISPQVDYSFRRKNKVIEFTISNSSAYNVGADSMAIVTIFHDPSLKFLPSDSVFFSKLDYSLPELIEIKTSVDQSNYVLAKKLLANYYRNRKYPFFDSKGNSFNQATIDDALNNTYSISGLKYNFGKGDLKSIDWSYSVEGNPNWSWEINRFPWWNDLSKAYLNDKTNGDTYAKRLFFELDDWLRNSPIDVGISYQLTPGNRWRHLEVGIRLESSWTQAFYLLKDSPLLSDELLINWVKGFYQHIRFLEINAELSTNRGFTEANGLFIGSVFFKEFSEAKDWQNLALKRMENVLKSDVNDDGSLKEFSPGYHNVTVGVVEKFISFSKINQIPISKNIKEAYEKLLNYYVLASEPTGTIPLMNDSYKFEVSKALEKGFKNFPENKEFEFLASNRKSGLKPSITSHLFKDAGQVVMRSGWKTNDSYLLMDAGPLGTSHGNEDKLSINVDGYGVRHIIDCGPYNYEDSNPYRIYSISSLGKSVPLVDGLGQNRRAVRELYIKKTNVDWFTSDKYDYASASYGLDTLEKLGKDLLRNVITTRHIFYLKPDVWILIDDYNPLDNQSHHYSTLFQCNDDEVDINQKDKRVVIQIKPGEFDPFNRTINKEAQPSLSISALSRNNIDVSSIKGQTDPQIAGWQFEKSTSWKKQAIPTVKFESSSKLRTQMAYVLAASPSDKQAVIPVFEEIKTVKGTYGLKYTLPNKSESIIIIVSLDQKSLVYKNKDYEAKALIIETDKDKFKITKIK